MNLVQRLKKARKNNDGFTLVEIVVVLVIIAILAVMMLGGYRSYINKARERAAIANCRNVVMASQVLLSEAYAAGIKPTEIDEPGQSIFTKEKVMELAGIDKNIDIKYVDAFNGKVTEAYVSTTDGKITIYYDAATQTFQNVAQSIEGGGEVNWN